MDANNTVVITGVTRGLGRAIIHAAGGDPHAGVGPRHRPHARAALWLGTPPRPGLRRLERPHAARERRPILRCGPAHNGAASSRGNGIWELSAKNLSGVRDQLHAADSKSGRCCRGQCIARCECPICPAAAEIRTGSAQLGAGDQQRRRVAPRIAKTSESDLRLPWTCDPARSRLVLSLRSCDSPVANSCAGLPQPSRLYRSGRSHSVGRNP